MPAGPASTPKRAIVAMKLAAAITHHRAARRGGDDLAERVDAVLQGHGGSVRLDNVRSVSGGQGAIASRQNQSGEMIQVGWSLSEN